jgi:hypothetical protein
VVLCVILVNSVTNKYCVSIAKTIITAVQLLTKLSKFSIRTQWTQCLSGELKYRIPITKSIIAAVQLLTKPSKLCGSLCDLSELCDQQILRFNC